MKNQEAIGRLILNPMTASGRVGVVFDCSERADWVFKECLDGLPENPKDFQHDYAKAYKEELKNNPDKHAQDMLKAIERGEKLEEDPYGA